MDLICAMLAADPNNRPASIEAIFKNFKYMEATESDMQDDEAAQKLFELHASLQWRKYTHN